MKRFFELRWRKRKPFDGRWRPLVEPLENRLLLTTYMVMNTNDSGSGSLRQAILDSNNDQAGQNTIHFNIAGTGLHTIAPTSPLPVITNPVIIDGTSQPGYAGEPVIVIDGLNAGSNTVGLWFEGGNNVVNGLVIERFTNSGIFLDTKGFNLVINNYLGIDPTGTQAMPNGVSGLSVSSSNNTIGGTAPQQGNLISGNNNYGINFFASAGGNLVVGNLIGTDITGTRKLGNKFSGIGLYDGSNYMQIGGTTPAARNVISGNGSGSVGDGISIFGTASAITVLGNFIGTDITGTQALANNVDGVALSASNNTIGGTLASAGNVISGNNAYGIDINNQASGNVVEANAVGTDVTGTQALPNRFSGIGVDGGAHNNTIGGTIGGSRNLISGNGGAGLGDGISLFGGATGNVVLGNLVGTNYSGTQAIPNNLSGIGVQANNNTIGGGNATAGNLVSGNKGNGIAVFAAASGNLVESNTVGTDYNHSVAVPNGLAGIDVAMAASNNTIDGNLVSGNTSYGLVLTDAGTTGNVVQGNLVGLDGTGSQPLANLGSGVGLLSGASFNMVGGLTPGAGNVISANGAYGLVIDGADSTSNTVQGNFIGTDASGTQPEGNGDSGVAIIDGAANNLIGGTDPGAANVIASNPNYGVVLFNGANANIVAGNLIGTDLTGTQPLGNGYGVGIYGGANNNMIGGTDAGSGNVISANGGDGVVIFNPDATGNWVVDNFIGTDLSGTQPLGDGVDGVNIQDSASDNAVIGNVIGNNGNDGVHVDQGTGNAIQQNSIANDGNLGIELTNGGNNEELAPEITAASTDGSNVYVQGDLNSLADTDFTLEFFANAGNNGAGFGEGQQFLGSITVTTDDNGHADFATSFAAAVDPGEGITTTATDSANNTSEFSTYFVLSGPLTPARSMGGQSSSASDSRTPTLAAMLPPPDTEGVVDQYFLVHHNEKSSSRGLVGKPTVVAPAELLGLDNLLASDSQAGFRSERS
jgi:titin